MSTQKRTRELIQYAKAIGIRDVAVHHRGRHPQIRGTGPTGKTVRVSFSCSPSDAYATAMAKRSLNRAVRQ